MTTPAERELRRRRARTTNTTTEAPDRPEGELLILGSAPESDWLTFEEWRARHEQR